MPPFAAPTERLLALLPDLAAPAPFDLVAALQALPDRPDDLPSPWDTWTLIGLARHRARQAWVLSVVEDRLLAEPAALARAGAFAHPDAIPDHGPVPGLPGWSYEFHGSGCCLMREASGEVLDVDFDDESAEHFDTYFYVGYVSSLRDPDIPEARISALCPDRELIALAIEDLQDAGVLLRGSHRVYFRLSPALIDAIDAIDALARALALDDPSRRLWLAARLGDWPWALELADTPELRALLEPRARRCRELRIERLRAALASGEHRAAQIGLRGLAALDIPDLADDLLAALADPPSGITSTALELMEARWDDRFADAVFALLGRVDPRGSVPEPHIFTTCAVLLLLRGCRVADVMARIAEAGPHVGARLLTLALAFRADSALALVRLGLRSAVPIDRMEVAALLAALDFPWTRRELLAVLAESDDLEATSECRAALRRSRDPDARAAVEAWERLHPYDPPGAPPYTGLDIHLINCDAWLAEEMSDQEEFLMQHRERLADPDDAQTPSRWQILHRSR